MIGKICLLALIALAAFLFLREPITRFVTWLFSKEQPEPDKPYNPHRFATELRSMDLQNIQDELTARQEELEILKQQRAAQEQLDGIEQQISEMQSEVARREHEI